MIGSTSLNASTSLLILLFVAVYAIDSIAKWLNQKTAELPLPTTLQSVQSPDDQKRAAIYLKDRVRFGFIQETFFLILFFGLLKFDIFRALENWVNTEFSSLFVQTLVFAGVLLLGRTFLGAFFSAYSTFKIETHYGFNRTSVGTFLADLLKGVALTAVIGSLLLYFVIHMLIRFGTDAWWVAWLGYTAFQFFLVWIAPVALLPLFLKLTPLAEGKLREEIETYSQKQKFRLDEVWVCDASKRSSKSNAFFTGFGRFRRLVLFDTLVEKHPASEVVAIVAHEAGHFKLGHIWKLSIASSLGNLAFFFIVQKLTEIPTVYEAFGALPGNPGVGLVFAAIILGKVLFFFSPLGAYFSRRNEYAADHFSVETTGNANAMAEALKRLVSDNLATLQHHWLYVILHDSHPPLPNRIRALKTE
jgi:STE24 endopeptidase